MSYPDIIKARLLRQGDRVYPERGDRVYTERGATRRVLATCWRPGWSFIRILVEGENVVRELPIGRAVYVRKETVIR